MVHYQIQSLRAEQSRAEQSRAEQSRLASTEQSTNRNKEKLQTASKQDMTQESQTCGQTETLSQKICIDTSMSGLDGGAIRTYTEAAPSITAREYKEPRMILE